MSNLTKLITESRNERTKRIDDMTTEEILTTMNEEDMKVAIAIQTVLPEIEQAVEAVVQSFENGGRLFYIGAGTSGRIGILDAVECPPTFSTSRELVQGIIAGGKGAIEVAVEGAEDSVDLGAEDLKERQITKADTIIGIAASGRTPYVAGALKYAQEIGATTVSLTSNENSVISEFADIKIEVITGPEVLTGSTRLKAASAHKMILNMISTTSMIKMGKVYENLMVDVNISNQKLLERAIRIIQTVTDASYEVAKNMLLQANKEVKPAIVMINGDVSYEAAKAYIEEADGYVRQAIRLAEINKK
ncbi:MAG TPA: N-acetylmuramic acid 6-phosphate etherase [Bacillota bacterium]|nr:N-acetylmuramic acid 6-phosphate etherase [Bacillota bacterium]